jgi:DNA invertase Pin-like site-specific DNA recombinase
MRILAYARVSTTDQRTAAQRDAITAWAAREGVAIARWYIEKASGRAGSRRPRLEALVRACRAGGVDCVAATRLDRLGRSTAHLATLVDELHRLGVRLVLVEQAIDTNTPAGKLLVGVLASIAEFESELISERTRAGMAAAKRRGARFGGPRPALVGERAELARRLLNEGASVRHVARTLGCSAAAVRTAWDAA